MSTVKRRRGPSLHLDFSNVSSESVPPVAAVFLVLFDIKAGYSIAWKRAIPDLELDGSVEFKSLPSGLHNVTDDLIYFVHHEEYAGISAFINTPAQARDRNAVMLAVGALVPLSYGRLGKSWRHALELKSIAEQLAEDPSDTVPLEEFWTEHRIQDDESEADGNQIDSPSVQRRKRRSSAANRESPSRARKRAITTASEIVPPARLLSSHHPALSLPIYLDLFGPLIFPIFKAALLRKRILLVGQAPVELSCNFVYDISILSGLPSAIVDSLPLEPLPTRLPTLFSVGIHDIPLLSGSQGDLIDGWVACTTDDILATKPDLFDLIVQIPPAHTKQAKERVWPKVKARSGPEVKATQRDLRRFQALRQGLIFLTHKDHPHSPYAMKTAPKSPGTTTATQSDDLRRPNIDPLDATLDLLNNDDSFDANIVEPQSWSALAYDSYMWWASAGERRTDLDEEEEGDRKLLSAPKIPTATFDTDVEHNGGRRASGGGRPITPDSPSTVHNGSRYPLSAADAERQADIETSIIAYFHRLTERILGVLADVVDTQDADVDQEDEGDAYDKHFLGNSDNGIGGTVTSTEATAETNTLKEPQSRPPNLSARSFVRKSKNSASKQEAEPSSSSSSPPKAQASAPANSSTSATNDLSTRTAMTTKQRRTSAPDNDTTMTNAKIITENEAMAEPEIEINSDDMLRMGLDVWSENDRAFVKDLVGFYWGRRCTVTGWAVECCGVRIL